MIYTFGNCLLQTRLLWEMLLAANESENIMNPPGLADEIAKHVGMLTYIHFWSMFILSTIPMKKHWFHLATGKAVAMFFFWLWGGGLNEMTQIHHLPIHPHGTNRSTNAPLRHLRHDRFDTNCDESSSRLLHSMPLRKKSTTAWHLQTSPLCTPGSHPPAGHAEKTLRDFGSWLRSCPATSGKRFVIAGNHDFWLEE